MTKATPSSAVKAGVVGIATAALLLTGCAGAQPSPGSGTTGDGVRILPDAPPAAIPADGEVIGQGTVLQIDGERANFCLGAVAESYPPQCSGPELVGWDWASVDGEESASSVTWGTYAVQGTWDGERLTMTQPPIMLALYDPMAITNPYLEPDNAGDSSDADLAAIQTELHERGTVDYLSAGAQNGYLFVTVLYDDGQIQDYFDEVYGAGVVVVESALRPVAP